MGVGGFIIDVDQSGLAFTNPGMEFRRGLWFGGVVRKKFSGGVHHHHHQMGRFGVAWDEVELMSHGSDSFDCFKPFRLLFKLIGK